MDYLSVVAYMAWADRITDRAELARLAAPGPAEAEEQQRKKQPQGKDRRGRRARGSVRRSVQT
jgi:hypothetical protein